MGYSARTDLAIEAREMHLEKTKEGKDFQGIEYEEQTADHDISITSVKVTDEKLLNKAKGTYITIEIPRPEISSQEAYEEACRICAKELSGLLKEREWKNALVIGLGNRNITADALGPQTVDSVLITRHLLQYMPQEIDQRLRSVCAFSPGVLGITGVETGEIVKGICQKVKPDLVIAVDALCSRRMERVNNTIQLTDTGIVPGAGIGNRRMALDKTTLGADVIAIGVPTVVDAATIAGDTIDRIVENLKDNLKEDEPLYKILSLIEEEDKHTIIKQVISKDCGDFIVTPKDIDQAISRISDIIANGINIALHPGISRRDIDRYK